MFEKAQNKPQFGARLIQPTSSFSTSLNSVSLHPALCAYLTIFLRFLTKRLHVQVSVFSHMLAACSIHLIRLSPTCYNLLII